ncbi:hypothetical protein K2X83_00110, partial [Patescibacteria group bacterium]|nr:hypothetical protein [Patescibacteria group bacterium]
GTIAALLLDILVECEGFSRRELQEAIDAELFNAFFIIPRSVGFIGHFMEQKKHDEGLFRLDDRLLFERDYDPESPLIIPKRKQKPSPKRKSTKSRKR